MELVEGEDARRAHRAGRDSARRGAADREADRRGARSGARAGHHPSRSEAGEHQGARRRHGEGAGLRPGEGAGAGGRRDRQRALVDVADDHVARAMTQAGHDPRHRRLHEPRAGARQDGRQARRHLGVRLRAVRDAHRHAPVRRRRRLSRSVRRSQGAGLDALPAPRRRPRCDVRAACRRIQAARAPIADVRLAIDGAFGAHEAPPSAPAARRSAVPLLAATLVGAVVAGGVVGYQTVHHCHAHSGAIPDARSEPASCSTIFFPFHRLGAISPICCGTTTDGRRSGCTPSSRVSGPNCPEAERSPVRSCGLRTAASWRSRGRTDSRGWTSPVARLN